MLFANRSWPVGRADIATCGASIETGFDAIDRTITIFSADVLNGAKIGHAYLARGLRGCLLDFTIYGSAVPRVYRNAVAQRTGPARSRRRHDPL